MIPEIRPVTPLDHGPLQAIGRAAWHAAYAHIYSPDEIDAVFDGQISQVSSWTQRRVRRLSTQVAEVDGVVCGFLGLAILDDPDEGEITSFYIRPDYQRRGVGRALWAKGLEMLRAAQCEHAWVWTLAKAPAVAFYQHLGCTEVSRGSYALKDHSEVAIGFQIAL